MKVIKYGLYMFLIIGINIMFNSTIYASSNPVSDYTYVDCENGSDIFGTPFDKASPYFSLKKGVEASIQYLNTNNYHKNTAYTSYTYNIFVKPGCFVNGLDGNQISLDFVSENNSSVQIAGLGGNFVIDNVYFYVLRGGNIIFRNVNFWRNDLIGYYFRMISNGNGIKIYDSLININTWGPISYNGGGVYIENSLINITVSGGWVLGKPMPIYFNLPIYLKNNKLVLKNPDSYKYSIYFYPAGNNNNGYDYSTINMISNEIDMGGNNFYTANGGVTYINNNFKNVGNFMLGTDESTTKYNIFLNNQIECTNKPNITSNESVFNNVFLNGFVDTRDVNNFKRNFSSANNTDKGIGWIFKRYISSNKTLNTDYRTFYKEITGNDLPPATNPLYISVH